MREVTLTPDELYQAAMAGIHRHITCIRAGTPNDQNWKDPRHAEWTTHIEGAAAELVVAKVLNRYPSAMVFNGAPAAADVGGKIHVRSSTLEEGCLIVRDRDPDSEPFVFVTGHAPTYVVHGWIYGIEAKQDMFRRSPGGGPPAYFVPKGHLKPLPGGTS